MNTKAEQMPMFDVALELDMCAKRMETVVSDAVTAKIVRSAATFVRNSFNALTRIQEAPNNSSPVAIFMQQVAAHALDPEKWPEAPPAKFDPTDRRYIPVPVPMLLNCPSCGVRHIDEGEFETKLHHTHACQHCGMVWRPSIVATVGVRFLPGFKNQISEEQPACED